MTRTIFRCSLSSDSWQRQKHCGVYQPGRRMTVQNYMTLMKWLLLSSPKNSLCAQCYCRLSFKVNSLFVFGPYFLVTQKSHSSVPTFLKQVLAVTTCRKVTKKIKDGISPMGHRAGIQTDKARLLARSTKVAAGDFVWFPSDWDWH